MSLTNHSVAEPYFSRTDYGESPFISFVKAVHPLSKEAQDYLSDKIYHCRIRKNDLLISAGTVCSSIFYVHRGILRGYVKEGIKEITTWISGERELITSITGFDQQRPALENIQAIEDCELIGLKHEDLEYLYENFPEANIIGRKVLQQYYRDAEERAFIARLTEATAKYKRFIATKSNMLNRVPLKFIASYLGMTLETLSRIRSKLSRTNGVG